MAILLVVIGVIVLAIIAIISLMMLGVLYGGEGNAIGYSQLQKNKEVIQEIMIFLACKGLCLADNKRTQYEPVLWDTKSDDLLPFENYPRGNEFIQFLLEKGLNIETAFAHAKKYEYIMHMDSSEEISKELGYARNVFRLHDFLHCNKEEMLITISDSRDGRYKLISCSITMNVNLDV